MNSFQVQKYGGLQRCCVPSLNRVSESETESMQICWASIARQHFSKGDCVTLRFRFELFQTHAANIVIRNQFHSSAVRLKKRPQPEPPPRELDLLRYDMKDLWKSPKPALVLGFAGLIPFVSPTLLMAVTESYCPELAFAQLAYGASIVSFLGGARWGFALPESSPSKPDWMNLANSVVPPLLAWVTMLMSDSLVPAVSMVVMALGISLHYDLSLLPTYPSWFKALRSVLTTVAFLSLIGTLIINGIYPEKRLFLD